MSVAAGWVIPESLRACRERMGLTAEEVESQSRKLTRRHYTPIMADELKRWEAGMTSPELEHLETLAQVYRCAVCDFFSEEPVTELSTKQIRFGPLTFRGLTENKSQSLSAATRQTLARFLEMAEWFTDAVKEYGVTWQVGIRARGPNITNITEVAQQEAAQIGFAESVRSQWTTADDAFEWWRRRIESLGVFCFQLKLDPREIRGASMWTDRGIPFILVNHQDAEAATGRLFTLLHEYCHLLMKGRDSGIVCDFRESSGDQPPESTPNRFAARILLPLDVLRKRLEKQGISPGKETWSDRQLDRLRESFFVSRDVMAISLEELGWAPRGFYRQKQSEWEKRHKASRGWGKPLAMVERKIKLFGSSGFRVLSALKEAETFPLLEAAYVLDTKVEKVGQLIELACDKLFPQA